MADLAFTVETAAPPDAVLAALTDFSDRRPEVWPGMKREQYELLERGDTWAVVKEGSGGSIWARERYDWATPGTVTWTVQDSGTFVPGDFVSARVVPRTGGGSTLHITWRRRGKNLTGKLVVALIVLLRGGPVKSSLRAGLKRLESAA